MWRFHREAAGHEISFFCCFKIVHLYVCKLCINFQDLHASHLFVISFEMFVFSAIATGDRQSPLMVMFYLSLILYTKMFHFVVICFLTSRSSSMWSKKIMAYSEDVFNSIDCSKARQHDSR